MEYILPNNWTLARLEEITEPANKWSFDAVDLNDEFIYLDINSVDNALNKITNPKSYKFSEAPSRAQQIVKHGDIVFSTVRTYLKNIAQVESKHDNQIASTGFCVIRPMGPINKKYIFYLTLSKTFIENLNELQRGSSYPAVRNSDVLNQPIPLPPLNEQNRIVLKLDELLSELEKGKEQLHTSWEQLKVYRQSILKHAFEGKLSEEWRRNNPVSSNSIVDLIFNDHRAFWENEQLKIFQKKKKKPIDDKWKDAFKPPPIPTKNKFLPSNWFIAKLDFLALFITDFQANGSFADLKDNVRTYYEPNYAVMVRLKDLRKDMLRGDDFLFTDKSGYEYLSKSGVSEGDVLVANVGAGVGTTLLMPRFTQRATLAPNMFRVDLTKYYLNEFFFYFCQGNNYWQQVNLLAGGSGQPKMNKGQYRSIELPLMPLEEQEYILDYLKEQFSIIENLEETINFNLKEADLLKQSILQKAFEGKLVEQDSNDERASLLLERITKERQGFLKAEKERRQNKGKTMRKIKTKSVIDFSLIDTIKENFGKKQFTFDQLKSKIDLKYDDLREELLTTLDSQKLLEMEFDKKNEVMKFKYKGK